MSEEEIKKLVDRFLAWEIPKTVCSDLCMNDPRYPYPRSGTCIMTADEAKQMIEYLLAGKDSRKSELESLIKGHMEAMRPLLEEWSKL